jgi:protein subunit release factor A
MTKMPAIGAKKDYRNWKKSNSCLTVIPEDVDGNSSGTGGDEASIFAGDLYRMYTKYCEKDGELRLLI